MQIIERTPSWGSSLGTALGQGLSEGIGQIANIKLQKMLEKQQYKQQQERGQEIWEGLGFPSNVAKALGSMGQQAQTHALSEYSPFISSAIQKSQQQQQQPQQGLAQILSQNQQPTQQQNPQQPPSQQRIPSQIEQAMAYGSPLDRMARTATGNQAPQIPLMGTQPVTPQIQPQAQPQQIAQQPQAQPQLPPMSKTEARQREKEQEKAMDERKLALQEAKFKEAKEIGSHKLAQKYEDKVYDKAEAEEQNISSFEALERLDDEGKLVDTDVYTVLDKMGLNIPALMSPETQEYKEIVSNFLRNAKAMFGAKITDNEIKMFMHTLPDLANTPEGRKRIIRNLKIYSQAFIVKRDVMDQIIKENNGVPPRDLRKQVHERAKPTLDDLGMKLKMGINADPEYQEKYLKDQLAKGVSPDTLIDPKKVQEGSEANFGGTWHRMENGHWTPLKE